MDTVARRSAGLLIIVSLLGLGATARAESEEDDTRSNDSGSSFLTWVERTAWVGTLAGLGYGTYQLLLHNRDVKRFNEHGCFESESGPYLTGGNGGSDDLPCKSLADSYDLSRKRSFTGYLAAGAFAATGVVLHILSPDEPSHQQARATACAPQLARDGLGMVCAATF
jgi:hypothetical protein